MTAAVSFFFAGKLLKRFGERRLLFTGLTLSELTNLGALLLASVASPVLMGATSIFFGVNTVSLNGMMQREFSDAQRSTMGSLTAFGGSLLFTVVSVGLGMLADRVGVQYALIVITLLSFVPLIFYRLAFQRRSTMIAVTGPSQVSTE
jgi:MFS family permease